MGNKMNNDRVFSGGGPRPDNRKHKQEEASQRLEAWNKMSPTQQIAELDRRLGKDTGAKKQRARISARMNRPQRAEVRP